MAPIKFEEDIKDKLEKRSLSPSAISWLKLSERLDKDQKKSSKSTLWWTAVAASVIITGIISTLFFTNKNLNLSMPKIANEQEQTTKTQLEDKVTPPKFTISKGLTNTNTINLEKENIANTQSIANTKKPNTNSIRLTENKNLKENSPLPHHKFGKHKDLAPINPSLLKNKEEITNLLKDVKSEINASLDKEVDSLLKLAHKELFKDKLQKEMSNVVDASTLLLEVEEDMGQSFRSKVFEVLKDSYNTVITTVAERNN